mgnify:CR=1 FL=1
MISRNFSAEIGPEAHREIAKLELNLKTLLIALEFVYVETRQVGSMIIEAIQKIELYMLF